MSRVLAQISWLLDRVQAIGETPGVNPVRLIDGALPPVAGTSPRLGVAGWAALTIAVLILIALVALFGPPTTAGFIYEHF